MSERVPSNPRQSWVETDQAVSTLTSEQVEVWSKSSKRQLGGGKVLHRFGTGGKVRWLLEQVWCWECHGERRGAITDLVDSEL